MIYDYIVVGGGIVGVSTAWQLQQRLPQRRVLLLEKEAAFAHHQTGHNSGVIHAGVYYTPDSLMARFCRAGSVAMMAFCAANDVPYNQCGKLLVATDDSETERMQVLFERARCNGLDVSQWDSQKLRAKEPNIVGRGALLIKDTAIVSYPQVTQKMAAQFIALGGEARLEQRVVRLSESTQRITVETLHRGARTIVHGRFLITCAGLMADRMISLLGILPDFQILPFRGMYYRLASHCNRIVKRLIYPIPDPAYPFLGVHLTRMIDGSITVGPNALQILQREGYGKLPIALADVSQMVRFSGFWKALGKNFKPGLIELKNTLWKPGYLQLVRKYCPSIRLSDLQPYPAGVRAQAFARDGSMIEDFLFIDTPRSLHVANAPSPAATSAIPIGGYICDQVIDRSDR